MTVATKLSLARILLTFVIMALLFVPGWAPKAWCLVLFGVASLTDWLDGWVARRFHQVTPLGILLDPIADKVLVIGVLMSFVQLGLIAAWMVLVIFLREMLITGVRLYAARRQVVIPATREGKHKTVSQRAAIILILVVLNLREWVAQPPSPAFEQGARLIILAAMWWAVALTVISGASFFWRNRSLLTHASAR